MGRKPTPNIVRPPCPRGHTGIVRLHGSRLSAKGRFEKTRYFCVPEDRGEKPHAFITPLALRREISTTGHECESCERVFRRAEGIATGWRFAFSVRDAANALVRAGKGGDNNSYRQISSDLRGGLGRSSVRGKHIGSIPPGAQLASDYLDAFASIVNAEVAPSTWPPIVALDDKPVYRADHSQCCQPYRDRGQKPPLHHQWPPLKEAQGDEGDEEQEGDSTEVGTNGTKGGSTGTTVSTTGTKGGTTGTSKRGPTRRPKISHDAPMIEVGRILVAVGYETPTSKPRPWLIRFAGGKDEVSWTEFLESLPGAPEWVVSDRDQAIGHAVRTVFPSATHYFCEQHIAQNAADVARSRDDLRTKAAQMNTPEIWHPFLRVLENAQFDEAHWTAAINSARQWNLPETERWLIATTPLVRAQWKKLRPFYPRSAGACERVVAATWAAIEGRARFFRNADRLNLLLGLIRSNLDGAASVAVYSRILRTAFSGAGGKANPDWWAIRDPAGESSIMLLYADTAARAKVATSRRNAPKQAANHRARRMAYEQERMILGLPASPRGRPRIVRATGSVAGKHVSDFGWLVAEWHPTANGELTPEEVPAGSGMLIWWKCPVAPDHEWAAQVRSRTLRGVGCRFCAHRAIARSESLLITHPDIAAQWHPTKNGTKTPADFTYGSHQEIWWQCPKFKGHVWRARISSRTSQVSGCSICGGTRVRADAIDTSAKSA